MTQGRKAGAFAPMGGYRYVQRLAEQGGRLFCTFRRVVYRFETSFVDGRWRGSVVRFPAPYDAGEEVWRGDVVAAWRFLHERCGRVFPAPRGFAVDPAAPTRRISLDRPAPDGAEEGESEW